MNYSWDGYLNGSTEFNINITVNGAVSTLQLINDTSPSLLLASGKWFGLIIVINYTFIIVQRASLSDLLANDFKILKCSTDKTVYSENC